MGIKMLKEEPRIFKLYSADKFYLIEVKNVLAIHLVEGGIVDEQERALQR
ncbi:hypothetical protein ACTGUY_09985 [Streptococcus suis]